MQTSNRVFDDLAKVANGAVSTLVGVKAEVEAMVRQQIERLLADSELVPRDEFDAVKAMAAEARLQQEKLEKRVAELEAQVAGSRKTAPARKKPATSKKASTSKKPRGGKTTA